MAGSEKLTFAKLKSFKRRGRYCDGAGLWLQVSKFGTRSWLFQFTLGGKVRQHGLGGFPDVSMGEARDRAAELRKQVRQGIDPIAQKKIAAARAVKFRDFAEEYIKNKRDGWKNQKHQQQWTNTLTQYAYPILGDVSIADIDKPLVLKVLRPIWRDIAETSDRLRGRIEKILEAARSSGLRDGDNPAKWRDNLEHDLPSKRSKLQTKHHAAIPYPQLPGFMAELRGRNSVSARALEFSILTAARTGETIGARWREIDFDAATWIVPAFRMKGKREHRVPLCARALAILKAMRLPDSTPDNFIFPGWSKEGRDGTRPLSNMALLECTRQIKRGITTHGFRSAFSDWVGDETTYDSETREFALAHVKGDKAAAAYRRRTAFDKRRRLLTAWERYCSQPPATSSAKVVPLRKAGRG